MSAVIGLVGTIAVVSWIVAVWSALQIVSVSPAGSRWRNYVSLGRFRFDEIRATAGALSETPIRRFRASFLIFFASVSAGLLASMAFAASR